MNHAFVYREFPAPEALASFIECVWLLRAPDGRQVRAKRVLPDNCIDVYVEGERDPVIVGPSATFRECPLSPGAQITGLRVRAGAGGAVLGLSVDELRDRSVALKDLSPDWAAEMGTQVCLAESDEERVSALTAVFASRRQSWSTPDRLVIEAVRLADLHQTGTTVRQLCADLDMGERHLRRRFMAAVGYGPKRFLRVVRFQRLLSLLRRQRTDRDWAGLALDVGYADQAHMINEVDALAGVSPGKLGL
jgi:AraC-like DNA-binding protein